MRFWNGLNLGAGDVVALEGAPIYLTDNPAPEHHHAFVLMQRIATALKQRGCVPQHYLLLDEYNGAEMQGVRAVYKAVCTVTPTHTILESEMCGPALELLGMIPDKLVDKGGNTGQLRKLKVPRSYEYDAPLLVRNSGLPACALLDGAFQRGKQAALNIVIHPEVMTVQGELVSFREQQAGVLAVLSSVRTPTQRSAKLPWKHGMLNIWLDASGEIVEVVWTRNKGSNLKSVTLRHK